MDKIDHYTRNGILILQWKLRFIFGGWLAKRICMALEHLLLH